VSDRKQGVLAEVLVILLLLSAVTAHIIVAVPVPPLDIQEWDSRRSPPSVSSVAAQAGNITELLINATVITKTWQGYFGNITGKIVLDDANNKSMYDWNIVTPQGEIYAANETVDDWSSIKCFNYSASAPELNLSKLEQILDCVGDADGVNETFTTKNHPGFWVGSTYISPNTCWSTQTYVNDGTSNNFYEVLLLEPNKNIIVYTSIINASKTGFDNTLTDFQMLVGENGHGSAASTTTQYYFYVELY